MDLTSPIEHLRGPHLDSKRTVTYMYDDDVGAYAFNIHHPMKPHRMRMTHSLVTAYGMHKQLEVIKPPRATAHAMTAFHTDEYIDFLARVTPETSEKLTGGQQRFLAGTDCPAFDGLFEFCSISAGGSIASAQRLNLGRSDICINWAGGLHHAKKREASGFCYVNDIVLAILELLRYHARVLYIDIDIHHGDGVEEAFFSTDRVMTCSLHKYGDFFPGTGEVDDRGIGRGKGYAVNLPLKDGIDDKSYRALFQPIIKTIVEWYRPGAIVLQCGADSLAADKLGCFNLSSKGHAECVRFVRSFNLPLMILGGGGYTIRNVARAWAYETGVAAGIQMDDMLPFNDYFDYYGPEFRLDVPSSNMENTNTKEELERMKNIVLERLRHLPFAPSVQMQDVPSQPFLAENEEFDSEDDDNMRLEDRAGEHYADLTSRTAPSRLRPPTRASTPRNCNSAFASHNVGTINGNGNSNGLDAAGADDSEAESTSRGYNGLGLGLMAPTPVHGKRKRPPPSRSMSGSGPAGGGLGAALAAMNGESSSAAAAGGVGGEARRRRTFFRSSAAPPVGSLAAAGGAGGTNGWAGSVGAQEMTRSVTGDATAGVGGGGGQRRRMSAWNAGSALAGGWAGGGGGGQGIVAEWQ